MRVGPKPLALHQHNIIVNIYKENKPYTARHVYFTSQSCFFATSEFLTHCYVAKKPQLGPTFSCPNHVRHCLLCCKCTASAIHPCLNYATHDGANLPRLRPTLGMLRCKGTASATHPACCFKKVPHLQLACCVKKVPHLQPTL